jgi:AAA15 family ATPase/GTPase
MLVEFSVQNFRSIHQRQTLSLVASKDKTLQDSHTIQTGVSAVPRVLRTAGLYGANGSGKTNLLHAFGFFQWFVKNNFSRSPDDPTNLVPFAFQSDEGRSEPGEFEATILIDGVRYQYGFRMDAQRIHEEWLLVYKTQKGQAWFERAYRPDTGKYEYQFN